MIDDDDDHGVDDGDEPSAAALDPDTVATGAAADSAADADDRLKGLPRILRYAMLINDRTDGSIAQRLIAEIDELCPGLPANIAWAADPAPTTGLALAAELDRLAVLRDLPLLRSLSDCARLLSVSLPCDAGRRRRAGWFPPRSCPRRPGAAAWSARRTRPGRRWRPGRARPPVRRP